MFVLPVGFLFHIVLLMIEQCMRFINLMVNRIVIPGPSNETTYTLWWCMQEFFKHLVTF